ncbi:MAG: hypothetical protein GY940_07870 [bacterium]|nr:hypothetical protein [bacterium]
MAITSQIISNYLSYSQIVFDNIDKVPNFKEEMVVVGYNDARYQSGSDKVKKTRDLYLGYLQKQDERKSKRGNMTDALDVSVKEFTNYVETFRMEFYDDKQLKAELGLKGPKFRFGSRFIDQSTNFYEICKSSPYVKAKLEGIQITTEMIENSIQRVDTLKKSRSDYEQIKGECQSIRELRDKAYRELKAWMSAFKKNAEYVYADNLQELERLNIFERNTPKRTKKNEPEPTDAPNPFNAAITFPNRSSSVSRPCPSPGRSPDEGLSRAFTRDSLTEVT